MQSTTERRQSILEHLCECRRDNVVRLATEFGVSERTIRNDIVVLSCSYPIYTQQGYGGGVLIAEGFRLGKKYLTVEQEDLLKRIRNLLAEEDRKILDSVLKTFTLPQAGEVKR